MGKIVGEADDNLVGRVKAHDVAALAQFLGENRKPLLAFIERQLGPGLRRRLEVDDIFQEVSVEAVRALETAEFEHREPFSWLCQIAERRIIDAHRRFFGAQKAGRRSRSAAGQSGRRLATRGPD